MTQSQDYSYEFYRRHAREYAEWWDSHADLLDLEKVGARLLEMVPPNARGLDAGCGPAVKEILRFLHGGYDMLGIDAVQENLKVAEDRNPELKGRLSVADISQPLDFPEAYFDFLICTTVIQHISPEAVNTVTLPEFARVLKAGGVLQLTFKNGTGVTTVYDKIYDLDRSFQLYEPEALLGTLGAAGMELVPREGDRPGGVMYYIDSKGVPTCILLARKVR